jgi:hypothetical protein
MEYYSALKRNGLLIHATTRLEGLKVMVKWKKPGSKATHGDSTCRTFWKRQNC